MHTTDEKLVSQTLAGDRDAFGVLVHKYQGMVYSYAFQKVRDEADSQDITQEVFLRAYRRLYQLRHPHRFRSWLYTIMANECNRWLTRVTKRRQREIALEDAADDALRVEPAYTVPTEGWEVDLEQAISALSDDNRAAVSMFYMGDCSLQEISEFLGVSVNTVKGKLYRARQQLGIRLSEHYGRFLKSHKLKGGFLMQFMEQVRHIPSPTMGFTWSSATVSKALFSVITALCVLIGLIGGRHYVSTELSGNQIWSSRSDTSRWPIEVAVFSPDRYATSSSVSGIPAPSGKHPLAVSNRVPAEQSRPLIDQRSISGNRDSKHSSQQLRAAVAESEGAKLIYSGRVIDNDGGPVADAEVFYSVRLNPSKSVTRTGMDGTFGFEILRPELKKWDRVDIIAMHPNHAIGWQNLQLKSTSGVEIRLGTPGSISGKIMNESAEPIENAEARIQYLDYIDSTTGEHGVGLGIHAVPISPAKTNADGEFVLKGLPQGAATNLVTQGPGYAMELHSRAAVGTMGLEFRLKREGRVEGHLSFAGTGEPVKNATVALTGIHPTEGWGRTHTDAIGNYLLKNIPPGTYNLYLSEGPEGWTAVAEERIKVVGGQTLSGVDLTLVRGGFITGRVTDRETGKPIADHRISFHDAARPRSQASVHGTQSDQTGAYRFRAAPGPALVYTSAPEGFLGVRPEQYVDVDEGKTVTVNFQFTKGIGLKGRILTESGEPVDGARVTDVRDWSKNYGRSNKQGEFAVDGMQVGRKLGLNAEHRGLRLRGTAEVEVQQGASVEIQVEEYHQVKVGGRVVDGTGEPIPSVKITLTRWDSQLHMGWGTTVALTDGDGGFRDIALIVGDQYAISASAEGFWNAKTDLFTATAEMDQIPNLTLVPAVGQFFIDGRVTDTSGKPVQGASVNVHHQSQHWQTLTDVNGNYRLNNLLMAVVIKLEIEHPQYAHHEYRMLKTNQRHDLVLVKSDRYLAGKVVAPDGKPIERATVFVDPQEDPSTGHILPAVDTNGQGEFELKHIKDPIVSIYVGNNRDYKIFNGIKVNQRDLVFTLTPSKPAPEPTSEQQTRWSYNESVEERFKTLNGKPAQEIAMDGWLSGSPVSIADLRGKTIVLYFWDSSFVDDYVQWIRLLNILQEAYGEKGLVCLAICPAVAEIATVERHIAEQRVSYPVGLDRPTAVAGAKGETFNRYAIGWGPPFVLITSAGEINGGVWDSELEDRIQTLLAD